MPNLPLDVSPPTWLTSAVHHFFFFFFKEEKTCKFHIIRTVSFTHFTQEPSTYCEHYIDHSWWSSEADGRFAFERIILNSLSSLLLADCMWLIQDPERHILAVTAPGTC